MATPSSAAGATNNITRGPEEVPDMEIIIALLLAAVTLAAALSASATTTRTGQHRSGAAVAEIEARLRREQTRTFVPLRGW